MKYSRFVGFILIILCFTGCDIFKPDKANFLFHNHSDTLIDSVRISGTSESFIPIISRQNIEPHERFNLDLDMSNFRRIDGSFYVEFYRNGIKTDSVFGYYSNGGVPPYSFDIVLLEYYMVIDYISD